MSAPALPQPTGPSCVLHRVVQPTCTPENRDRGRSSPPSASSTASTPTVTVAPSPAARRPRRAPADPARSSVSSRCLGCRRNPTPQVENSGVATRAPLALHHGRAARSCQPIGRGEEQPAVEAQQRRSREKVFGPRENARRARGIPPVRRSAAPSSGHLPGRRSLRITTSPSTLDAEDDAARARRWTSTPDQPPTRAIMSRLRFDGAQPPQSSRDVDHPETPRRPDESALADTGLGSLLARPARRTKQRQQPRAAPVISEASGVPSRPAELVQRASPTLVETGMPWKIPAPTFPNAARTTPGSMSNPVVVARRRRRAPRRPFCRESYEHQRDLPRRHPSAAVGEDMAVVIARRQRGAHPPPAPPPCAA